MINVPAAHNVFLIVVIFVQVVRYSLQINLHALSSMPYYAATTGVVPNEI